MTLFRQRLSSHYSYHICRRLEFLCQYSASLRASMHLYFYSASVHVPNRGLLNKIVKETNSCQINEGSHQHWHRPLKRMKQLSRKPFPKKGLTLLTCSREPPRSWCLGPGCTWGTPPSCRSRPGRSRGYWWPCRTSSKCYSPYRRLLPSWSRCLYEDIMCQVMGV